MPMLIPAALGTAGAAAPAIAGGLGAAGAAAPMMAPMAMQSPLTAGLPGLMKAGMGAEKMAGGLGGFLGMNRAQNAALPGLMSMMGQGMQGPQQQPQQAPQAPQAGNNPAAIQAAVQMMQMLKTQRGGFPQGLSAQFPGTRDRGGVRY